MWKNSPKFASKIHIAVNVKLLKTPADTSRAKAFTF
jgi:hypothetical protein